MADGPRCPICKVPIAGRLENEFYPFCSERCRMVDLGKWLGGDYAVPGPPASDADLAEAFRRQRGDDDDETVH